MQPILFTPLIRQLSKLLNIISYILIRLLTTLISSPNYEFSKLHKHSLFIFTQQGGRREQPSNQHLRSISTEDILIINICINQKNVWQWKIAVKNIRLYI